MDKMNEAKSFVFEVSSTLVQEITCPFQSAKQVDLKFVNWVEKSTSIH